MKAGDTFLIPDSDDHLWMVISDPNFDPDHLVVVCFLSWQAHYDQACIVRTGDHPFIKHDTCINYPAAKLVSLARLELLVVQGKIKPKLPLSPALLDRIRGCAEDADLPSECYAVLREQGFVP